jgi:hypothetical protein
MLQSERSSQTFLLLRIIQGKAEAPCRKPCPLNSKSNRHRSADRRSLKPTESSILTRDNSMRALGRSFFSGSPAYLSSISQVQPYADFKLMPCTGCTFDIVATADTYEFVGVLVRRLKFFVSRPISYIKSRGRLSCDSHCNQNVTKIALKGQKG